MKEYRAMERESRGYYSYSRGHEIGYKKTEEKITCKKGGFTYVLDTNFSDKKYFRR